MTDITRRDFAKMSGLAAAAAAAGSVTMAGDPELARASITGVVSRMAELPKHKGPRVVVIGGGWSGLTIAKYLKKEAPEVDVVLIERREIFISDPLSNLWLAGLWDLENLAHSFLDAAKNNGYTLHNATAIDVDRAKRRIYTEKGYVQYDYLVLAPGIEYDYGSIGVKDPADVQTLKTHYPAGFVSGQEYVSLKRKIDGFSGGVFAITIPEGIFRCSVTPYERACLIASVFKRRKIKAKILLIDSRYNPAVGGEGFLAAFKELYGGIIEYMNTTRVTSVDVGRKRIITEMDEISFDEASIYPKIRGARMIENLGLVDPKSPQKEAAINPFTYQTVADERVYVTGDSRPMPFSKSANTARTEGIYVARVIAAMLKGKTVPWKTPLTLCYSVVNAEPKEAISVRTTYRFDKAANQWTYGSSVATNKRSPALAAKAFEWARAQYRDMF